MRVLVVLAFYAVIGLTMFLSAGSSSWPRAWLWLAANAVVFVFNGVTLAFLNPEVVNERGKRHEGTKRFDKILTIAISPWYFGIPIVAGLDAVRYGWTAMPDFTVWIGVALLAISDAVILWAMIVNRHLETSVRIQDERGHQVVTRGPYRYVRHPMYVGMAIQFVSTPFILGSCWAFVPAILVVALFVVRTAFEDRLLRAELAGYAEYANRTRFRLVPLVW
jgi:protein-S-isoprenylcysteine O-methyltransferase Ste14